MTLVDVGPVTEPAYRASTTGVRSKGLAEDVAAEWQKWREQREKKLTSKLALYSARARLAGLE